MDGTLAVIFAIAGLSELEIEKCPFECFARTEATPRLSLQVSAVEFQDDIIGDEVFVGYDFGMRFGPVQPTAGISATDQGNIWVGIGGKWTGRPAGDSPLFVESYLMPGLFTNGDGPDLGEPIIFRSSLGIGYEFDNGARFFVSYEHRSNADLNKPNRGLENIAIQYSFPLD